MMTKATRLSAAVLSAGLALGTYAVGMSPASAASTQTFKNQATGKCMDAFLLPITYTCDGTSEQKWTVTHWADGTVRLKSVYLGTCLKNSGSSLTLAGCDSSTSQSFYVTHWDDGTIRFKSQATGKCLRASGPQGLYVTTCDSSTAESWY